MHKWHSYNKTFISIFFLISKNSIGTPNRIKTLTICIKIWPIIRKENLSSLLLNSVKPFSFPFIFVYHAFSMKSY